VRSGYRAPDRLLSTFMLYTATTILKEIDDDDDNDTMTKMKVPIRCNLTDFELCSMTDIVDRSSLNSAESILNLSKVKYATHMLARPFTALLFLWVYL